MKLNIKVQRKVPREERIGLSRVKHTNSENKPMKKSIERQSTAFSGVISSWKNLFRVIAFLSCFAVLLTILALNPTSASTAPDQTGEWVTHISGGTVGQRISMASENDGWFMYFNGSTAYLARYDGFNWSVFGSVAHSQQIVSADIEMVSADDGWLVLGGWLGSTPAESSIYHWDGTSWNFITTVSDPNAISLSSLNVLASDNAWALGTGNFWSNLYHWDGNSWSFAGKTPGGVRAGNDLDMLSANDGWAVGLNGAIARWDGASWTEVTGSTSDTLNAVAMVATNNGWAVGDNGAIQRWDGVAWETYASPTSTKLLGIGMVSADEGWIVGDGVILHWDGSQWSHYTPPLSDRFHDVDMLSSKDGWVIGEGSLLQYETYEPELLMNYSSGAPGSYFTVGGQNFPANSTAEITVNGRSLGTVPVNSSGRFLFILNTLDADEGTYFVTVSVNPTVTKQFVLDAAEPVRPQEDEGEPLAVPAGIAFTEFTYLPAVIK